MAGTAKQNGVEKKTPAANTKNGATTKTTPPVKKLAQEAIDVKVTKSLEERITNFEKLKGLANQRERLTTTLNDLNKFKFNNGDSCVFSIKDENYKEFKTSNNNLIQIVTDVLQETLTSRKTEIENEILNFDL
ncbi:hypothetical protein [Aquimarina macrocephali]|uniref:hypothetical protein n=1 Tax=Aquimarina macrocephali TaxID=666563 RepID=UPI00046334AC|nr:hypothetical protein [Aquimarina macrocephali]